MENKNALKVSVLIPAFNEEKYIIKTLEALMEQDYTNYEVIVINNASTDNTQKLIDEFACNNLYTNKIISSVYEQKRGTNYARECGRKIASGEIIAQLDADCIACNNWISKGVSALQKKNAVAVTGPYDYFDTFFIRRQAVLFAQVTLYAFVNKIIQVFRRGALLIGGNSFIAADVLDRAGGYNTDLTFYGDDIDIAARVALLGYVHYSAKLIMKTSSRRFTALGFRKVQKKYRRCFWNLILYKKINASETCELVHPR